jgi:hypothetical protein
MVPKIRLQELRGDLEILKTNNIRPNDAVPIEHVR